MPQYQRSRARCCLLGCECVSMDGNRFGLLGALEITGCLRSTTAIFRSTVHSRSWSWIGRAGLSRLVARMAGTSAGMGLAFLHWMGGVFRHRIVGAIPRRVECD